MIAQYTAASLGLTDPANLAIGPDGNLYVTDARQRVSVISPHGEVLRRWGTLGSGPGQFHFVSHDNSLRGVAASIDVAADGTVYVADSGNARVEEFTASGRFLRAFGSFGQAPDQFAFPHNLMVTADGAVIVADDTSETLTEFSPTGAVRWQLGGNDEKDPELIGHFHVSSSATDAHGRIVVANDDRNRVLFLDSRGNVVDSFGGPDAIRDRGCDVTIDPAGYVFVNNCTEPLDSPHVTEVFDRSHHLVATWDPSPLGWSPRFGANGEIFGLTEDGSIVRLRRTVDEG